MIQALGESEDSVSQEPSEKERDHYEIYKERAN